MPRRRDLRRHLAGRALPRGRRRGAGRRAPHPPAQRPVAGPRRGRLGRAADPAGQARPRSPRRPRAGRSRRATSSACARAPNAVARLRALARSARELAEGAHREDAPHARSSPADAPGTPFSAVELRAGVAAAELLEELAALGDLPGAEAPGPGRGDRGDRVGDGARSGAGRPTGRVRIMSPYRARAARVRVLFCAGLQEGEFPSSAPPDPLLSEERRAQIGNPDLASRRPGRRGALPVPRLRLAPDRAPVLLLAELRRGRRGEGPRRRSSTRSST